MARQPSRLPTKSELLDALDRAEVAISQMIGDALDGIPAAIRDRLADIVTPLHALLRRARRR